MLAKEISEMLAKNALFVSRDLFPNGKQRGAEWCIGSMRGEAGDSLKIHLKGSKAGVWSDFATGESGDLLDLWASKNNISLIEAIKDCRNYFNLRPLPELKAPINKNYKKPVLNCSLLGTESKAFQYLCNERLLTQETISLFKIQVKEEDIVFPYYCGDYIGFVKYLKVDRENGKKKMWIESGCEPILFGWQAMPKYSRTITICEGEIDAMTLSQYGIPALSVPFGGGTGAKHEWIEREYDKLSIFDEIYICMDQDDPGQFAAQEICERLGYYRCKLVVLPRKDANDCLKNNVSKHEIEHCFESAKTLDPLELKKAILYYQKTLDRLNGVAIDYDGYQSLWKKSENKISFRPHELSIWTGINGHGKSLFLGQVVLQMIQQGAKVCIASMEMRPEIVLGRMTKQATAMNKPSNEYISAVFDWFDEHLWYFELMGTARSKRLLEVFLYARQRYGIDVFIIDSFLTLDIAEDDYKAQKIFIEALRDFKNQHACQVHMVVHPRKPSDESQPPNKLDNKGTGAITDLADNCFCVWRHKAKEKIQEKKNTGHILTDKEIERLSMADALWICDKQRNGEWEGTISMWFDRDSFQYRDCEHHKSKPFVDYSCLKP
ncbi:MAG TPA: toprim domain-containing protein [Gammaproteobacteria bacterium]|nr:toprim domain-containing protein [Gammaproteobacteria bacterium]